MPALESKPFSFAGIPSALLSNRQLQVLAVLLAIAEIYNHALLPAYIATQQTAITRTEATFASLKQSAEATLAEAKVINETQVAANAERRKKAEARTATALARKTEAEATIALETSINSPTKAKAEAEATEADAEIAREKATVQAEIARQQERRRIIETKTAELNTEMNKWQQQYLKGNQPVRPCVSLGCILGK
jgi:hypothetical protein